MFLSYIDLSYVTKYLPLPFSSTCYANSPTFHPPKGQFSNHFFYLSNVPKRLPLPKALSEKPGTRMAPRHTGRGYYTITYVYMTILLMRKKITLKKKYKKSQLKKITSIQFNETRWDPLQLRLLYNFLIIEFLMQLNSE